MHRRVFLVQKFIHMLIVIRLFTTHLFPLEFYLPFIAAMLVAQYFKEGLTPIVMAFLPLIALQTFAELNDSLQLQYVVAILGGIMHFIPMKVYWLPRPLKTVGFREDSLEGGLHYVEFYPLDESQPIEQRSIKWNLSREVGKMIDHKHVSNRVIRKACHLILSYVDHYNIKVGNGKEVVGDTGIAFAHGRGGTPMFYTSYFMHFAANGVKVGAAQHTDVNRTPFTLKEEIKRYREKEVQARAAELYQAILKLDKPKMILMGHSYGCATVVQAYHSLQPQLRDRVTHIVLLDPWLFPLTDSKFNQEIKCPILILANQDFVANQDIYERNSAFIGRHKAEYIVWHEGHHLHQTDIGFIGGNGALKNSHLTKLMLELNIAAIDRFLKGEQVEGTFGERDLGRAYKPAKFEDNLSL